MTFWVEMFQVVVWAFSAFVWAVFAMESRRQCKHNLFYFEVLVFGVAIAFLVESVTQVAAIILRQE